jgi:hypothetical protein
MKQIPLTQGKFTLVDDIDFEWLNQWKWYAIKDRNTFYAVRMERSENKRKVIWMHREILGVLAGFETDHKNHNGLDNQRINLRSCTRAENQHNRFMQKNNISGFKGVSWSNRAKKWWAQIKFNRRVIHLGFFISKLEAAKAYDNAAKKYFGEFVFSEK